MRCVCTLSWPREGPHRHTCGASALISALVPRGATPSHMRCVCTLSWPARGHTVIHAVRRHLSLHWSREGPHRHTCGASALCPGPARGHTVIHAVRRHFTLAGAATRCTGPRRGHSPGQLYARRRGYTLHWSSKRSLPWATLRSPARLHAAPVLNGSLPGHLYARRCGYTLHWSSTGSHPWGTLLP